MKQWSEKNVRMNACKPVIREIPSYLSEVATAALLHIVGLINPLHQVQQVFIWMFYVEVKPKGVQQNPFSLKYTFSSLLQAFLLS